MTTTIGLRFLTERKRLGLKQEDITSKLGIGRQTIHRYENNISVPSTKSVQALKTLGFDMDYVLTGVTQEEGDITPQELALLKLLRQAQPVISKLNVWAFNERAQTYLLHLPLISPSERMAAFLRCLMQASPDTNITPLLLASGLQTSNTPHPSSPEHILYPECRAGATSEPTETMPSEQPQPVHHAVPPSTEETRPQPQSLAEEHF